MALCRWTRHRLGTLALLVASGCGSSHQTSDQATPGPLGSGDPPPLGAMMQADPGYTSTVAADVVRANPQRFLMRIPGPAGVAAIPTAQIQAFSAALATWPGALVFSPDTDRHDSGDWPGFAAAQPAAAYVAYLAELQAALAGAKSFAEIAIETEGGTIGDSDADFQALRSVLDGAGLSDVRIGAVLGWTRLGAPPAAVDHTYIEGYNLYVRDGTEMLVDGNQSPSLCTTPPVTACNPQSPAGPTVPFSIYETMTPQQAAAQLVKIVGLKFGPTLPDLEATTWLFSYEPQFLGTSAQRWGLPQWSALTAAFAGGLVQAKLTSATVAVGVYQSAAAFDTWYDEATPPPVPLLSEVVFFADSPPDVIDALQANFAGAGLIGELSAAQRATYGKTFRIGMTCALTNGPQVPWWKDAGVPFTAPEDVLAAALAYPEEWPSASEPIVYSQDLAYIASAPLESYAQAVTLLWAARALLPHTPIWPNVGHSLMDSLQFDPAALATVLAEKLPAAKTWAFNVSSFPAFLVANRLVDGVIAQEYTHPGSVDFDSADLDYVLQCDASTALPATSSYCSNGPVPWRVAFYLPGSGVPSIADVTAVMPRPACD